MGEQVVGFSKEAADIHKMENTGDEDRGGRGESSGFAPTLPAQFMHQTSDLMSHDVAEGHEFLNMRAVDGAVEGSSDEEDMFCVSGVDLVAERIGDQEGDVPYLSDAGELSVFNDYPDELGGEYNTPGVGDSHALLGQMAVHQEHYRELHEAPFKVDSPYRGHRGDAEDPLTSFGGLGSDDVPMLTFYAPKLCSIFEGGTARIEGMDRDLAGYATSSAEEEVGEDAKDGCSIQDNTAAASGSLPQPRFLSTFKKAKGFDEGIPDCQSGEDIYRNRVYGESSGIEIEDAKLEVYDPYQASYLESLPPATVSSGKGRRLSRELGALLGYGHVDRTSKGTTRMRDAKQVENTGVVGGEGMPGEFAAGNKMAASPSAREESGRIRITRSKATGRFISHKNEMGNGTSVPDAALDLSGKRRGKRSVARGGRQGWGISSVYTTNVEVENPGAMTDLPKIPNLEIDEDLQTEAQAPKKRQSGKLNKRTKGKKINTSCKETQMAEEVDGMSPIVQHIDADEGVSHNCEAGVSSMESQGLLVVDSVETEDVQQGGKKLIVAGVEIGDFNLEKQLSSSLGRRRSMRLKGVDCHNNDRPIQTTDFSVIKVVQGGGRRGSRKRNTGLESVQNTEGLLDDSKNTVKVEALEVEITNGSEAMSTTPVGGGAGGPCSAQPVEYRGEEMGEDIFGKVQKLEVNSRPDETLDGDGGETGSAVNSLDKKTDCCEINDLERSDNVLDLLVKEESIQGDMLVLPGGEGLRHENLHISPDILVNEESIGVDMLELRSGGKDLRHGIPNEKLQGGKVDVASISKQDTRHLNSMDGSGCLDNCVHGQKISPPPVDTNCESILHMSKGRHCKEGEPVEVSVKVEAGVGESSDFTMKTKECDKGMFEAKRDPLEDSSSVTSRDDVVHRTGATGYVDSKGTSSDRATGFSESVCKKSKVEGVLDVAMNPELQLHGTSQVRPRKAKSKRAMELHGVVDHIGKGKALEERALRNLRSRSKKLAVGSLVEGSAGEKTGSLSTLEGGLVSQASSKLFGDTSSGQGNCKQGVGAGKTSQDNELDDERGDKEGPLETHVGASHNVLVGVAAGSANSPRKKHGRATKISDQAKKSEISENSSMRGKKGSRKTECPPVAGEVTLHLAKQTCSLKAVTEDTCGRIADDVKVECSTGALGRLARDMGSMAVGEDISSGVTEGEANTTTEKVDESAGTTSRIGWVNCDDCSKWRCIPVELAEEIANKNSHWSCRQNPNKDFADCSIAQVKSNAEINRELGISEDSLGDEGDDILDTGESSPVDEGTENVQAVWTLIRHNIFKHRSRKQQDVDEAMVCQCTLPADGEMACGEDCLNRMLNVECLPQQCPCGTACTNQQFQKRAYTKVEWFRCGKKGFGLQVKENVPMGSFIIEYVGEVLDMPSFEVRQKEYAVQGQKHFYFMTLSANEVIDACSKGNFGRFVNHSCEPNCRTEKWMVDGEVCIGLFAIRDLKEGEEITFDYNFVRVGGAVAKKCECGVPSCRGFIGVDPDTPCTVVDNGSDDGEDPEPIMLQADSDEEQGILVDETKTGPIKRARLVTDSDAMLETRRKFVGVKRKSSSGLGAKDRINSSRSKRVKTTALSKTISHGPIHSRGLSIDVAGPTQVNGTRPWVRNNHYSEVEEKLGELSYQFGGLKNRKDTARQYLKLLVLTAASGVNVKGAAACSVRDLSMLLEALLKTEKLGVLKDIMTKNGLQMFHILIKQFRKLFEKRPILRKILKVLDHLAKCKVLTVDHIYSRPPRSGMECFSDTLFELTRHDDLEVQNMARTFRRLYVPPRPQWTDVNLDNKYKQPHSSMHMQNTDEQLHRKKEKVKTTSPSIDSQSVLEDRFIVSLGLQQTSLPMNVAPSLGQVVKPPLIDITSGSPPGRNLSLQENLVAGKVLPCRAAEENLSYKPTATKRKRPSRWDTPKDPDVAGNVANDASTHGGIVSTLQAGPVSTSACGDPFFNRELLQSCQTPKPPGASLQEARCNQHGLSLEIDKPFPVPVGPAPVSLNLTQACVPIPTNTLVNTAVRSVPRPPPGPPPPGQPSVHTSTSMSKPFLMHSAGPQQLVLLPGQPVGQPQILVGMAGQRPMVPPGPVHIGMQVIPMGNVMAVMTPMPFNGGQVPSSNMFQGGVAVPLVPTQGGVPPGPHPIQGGPSPILMTGAQPLPYGFHPGPPAQGVPQQSTLMPPSTYVQWPMMHPSGGPVFSGHPHFPIDGKPLPPPPPLPAWIQKGQPQIDVSQTPASTANSESAEVGTGPMKRGVLAPQSSSSKLRNVELQDCHTEAEPPVPGLSPLRRQSSRKIKHGTAELSHHPSGSHNQSLDGRGGAPTLLQSAIEDQGRVGLLPSSSAAPLGERRAAGSHRYPNESSSCSHEWEGSSQAPGGLDGRDFSKQATCHSGDSGEKCGTWESKLGASCQSWETPECSSFHQHVNSMVRSRAVTKHKMHVKDAERFCSKLTENIVSKETKKYQENKSQGTAKPILRSRLLERVDAYVDVQVEIYNKKKTDDRQH